jgi:hypothetical protein
VAGPIADAGLALGVDGGEQQAAEQTEVLQEVGLVLRALRLRIGPERMPGEGGRHQAGGEREGGRPGEAAAGQQQSGDDVGRGLGPHEVARFGGQARIDLLDHRRDLVGDPLGRGDLGIRVEHDTDAADHEDRTEHGAGCSTHRLHNPRYTRIRAGVPGELWTELVSGHRRLPGHDRGADRATRGCRRHSPSAGVGVRR